MGVGVCLAMLERFFVFVVLFVFAFVRRAVCDRLLFCFTFAHSSSSSSSFSFPSFSSSLSRQITSSSPLTSFALCFCFCTCFFFSSFLTSFHFLFFFFLLSISLILFAFELCTLYFELFENMRTTFEKLHTFDRRSMKQIGLICARC